ncbi:Uncharacterized conserved protein YdeI, YjbR/CyaY-like superfamily, DUF1801 family [Pustulibacterium marinum]|uniref:Uncharacterized conserved protein YdeI, YjbR/CyaY-like superfamily, DUF1801 family n=1 Tax=Pustulibacterium marinum TaxID=1224947 RepID=A0A1I7IJT1_9FLAO|nr:DUF1801 domain-containing protein [Pustulibacterium marinum]SFU73183.1 Uncharacterized conserved protein YdeI, YjbR/CyaY-like superfamily, DUF1801 family [Pustulibacterium marinum]
MDQVSAYLEKHDRWKKELEKLRAILLTTELTETIKWGASTYTLDNKNVVGIGAFKSYCGLWFFQGALLNDTANLLYNAQEGKTKALRQWRFESESEIDEKLILKYVQQAIDNQKKGLEIKANTNKTLVLGPELQALFKEDTTLEAAFYKLTPGKQREYADYITEAKRAATKLSRLEKISPMILEGKGLHDKYKNC